MTQLDTNEASYPEGPHRIRLRGPWAVKGNGSELGRVKLPTPWGAAETIAPLIEITLTRPFGRGTLSVEFDRVTLRLESPHQLTVVKLNGQGLSLSSDPQTGQAWQIAPLLAERNVLEVTLRRSAMDPETSMLDAWMEIEGG